MEYEQHHILNEAIDLVSKPVHGNTLSVHILMINRPWKFPFPFAYSDLREHEIYGLVSRNCRPNTLFLWNKYANILYCEQTTRRRLHGIYIKDDVSWCACTSSIYCIWTFRDCIKKTYSRGIPNDMNILLHPIHCIFGNRTRTKYGYENAVSSYNIWVALFGLKWMLLSPGIFLGSSVFYVL